MSTGFFLMSFIISALFVGMCGFWHRDLTFVSYCTIFISVAAGLGFTGYLFHRKEMNLKQKIKGNSV